MKNSFDQSVAARAKNLFALLFTALFATPAARATVDAQPDLLVSKRPGSGFRGDGIYNDPASQSLSQSTRRRTVNSFIKAQNDAGRVPEDFTFAATRGNRKFRTRYFGDLANITAAITTGNFTRSIPVASDFVIRQKVMPTRRLRGNRGMRTYRVRVFLLNSDAVRIKVRKRR